MWSIERRVGRLVEIRIGSPVSIEETRPWQLAHDEVIGAVAGPYACFVDLADATVSTLRMQIQRIIREADHPDRRAFRDATELAGWLGAILDDAARRRLDELLFERRVTIPPRRG